MSNNNNNNLKTFLNSYDGSIGLLDSLEDSPQFRKQLKDTEQNLDDLSSNIKKLLKSSKLACEVGDEYNQSFKAFVDDILLYRHDANVKDELLEKSLIKFSSGLKEICNFRELLHMEMDALISTPLQQFADEEIRNAKDQYKKFDKYSQQYDTAASKLGQIKKKNSVKIGEVEQEVNESLKLKNQHGLDLVETMNQIQARRRFEFLEYFSVYLHAQSTFFHQGYELFRDLEPHMRVFSNYLQSTRKNFEEQKRLQTKMKHDLIEKTNQMTSPNSLNTNSLNPPSNGSNSSMSGSPLNGHILSFMTNRASSDNLSKRGYLFKRSEYNSYSRRFFSLESGKLSYYRTNNDPSPSHVFDLFLTTPRIREDLDRRYCFELLSPDRSIILAAESYESMQEWIQVIQNAIANLLNNPITNNNSPSNITTNILINNINNNNYNYNNGISNNNNSSNNNVNNQCNNNQISTPGSPSLFNVNKSNNQVKLSNSNNSLSTTNLNNSTGSINSSNSGNGNDLVNETPLTILRKNPSNQYCADCSAKDPDWASINFSCILCIDCSGIHRGLGVHISKVRSLVLDKWEPELLGMMKSIGNDKVNKIYEEKVPQSRKKPTPNDSFDIRSKWIRDKYDKRLFVNFTDKPLEELNSILYHVSGESNTSYLLGLIAQGADPNSCLPNNGKTPLHHAAEKNQTQNVCLLLQNGAYIDTPDRQGNTVLHYAADNGSADCSILFIMKSVKLLLLSNKLNQTPLDLAVDKGHVGCVAILRLAQLQKEEGKQAFDENFADVLRGFSKER